MFSSRHCSITWELPPRARRILAPGEWVMRPEGTTSACAENTNIAGEPQINVRNYLRVRGEYSTITSLTCLITELPSRARRIPILGDKRSFYGGTTSACAENTYQKVSSSKISGNYLRVRGEYQPNPPAHNRAGGTTSACAENTPPAHHENLPGRNYLRVRGEYCPQNHSSSAF